MKTLLAVRVRTAEGGRDRRSLRIANELRRAPLDEFWDSLFERLGRGDSDVLGFGPTDTPEFRSMLEVAESFFKTSAARFPVTTYSESR